MRMSKASIGVAIAIVVAAATPARAQNAPVAEGALGYAYVHDEDLSIGFPLGWVASVAGNATSWLALVGEVGGSYKKYTSGTAELKLRLHTFTAGPRLSVTSRSPIAPFAQVLVGLAHGSADFGVPGLSLVVRGTAFAFQPGFGVDLNASRNRALRFAFDLRGLRDDGRTSGQWRVVTAVVFRG